MTGEYNLFFNVYTTISGLEAKAYPVAVTGILSLDVLATLADGNTMQPARCSSSVIRKGRLHLRRWKEIYRVRTAPSIVRRRVYVGPDDECILVTALNVTRPLVTSKSSRGYGNIFL